MTPPWASPTSQNTERVRHFAPTCGACRTIPRRRRYGAWPEPVGRGSGLGTDRPRLTETLVRGRTRRGTCPCPPHSTMGSAPRASSSAPSSLSCSGGSPSGGARHPGFSSWESNARDGASPLTRSRHRAAAPRRIDAVRDRDSHSARARADQHRLLRVDARARDRLPLGAAGEALTQHSRERLRRGHRLRFEAEPGTT
jgi:hypothetical protein